MVALLKQDPEWWDARGSDLKVVCPPDSDFDGRPSFEYAGEYFFETLCEVRDELTQELPDGFSREIIINQTTERFVRDILLSVELTTTPDGDGVSVNENFSSSAKDWIREARQVLARYAAELAEPLNVNEFVTATPDSQAYAKKIIQMAVDDVIVRSQDGALSLDAIAASLARDWVFHVEFPIQGDSPTDRKKLIRSCQFSRELLKYIFCNPL